MYKDLTQTDSWAKCIAMAYAVYQALQPQMDQLFIQMETFSKKAIHIKLCIRHLIAKKIL